MKRFSVVLLTAGVLLGCGGGSGSSEKLSSIPAKVWAGGAAIVEIEASFSHPGEVLTTFEPDGDGDKALEARQSVPRGRHSFKIDVPAKTHGYFQVSIPNFPFGAKLSWTVRVKGKEITTEEDELTAPLGPNEAFFFNFEFDDVADIRF